MSRRAWTADLHLGHPAIIEYCKRPFKGVEHMNDRLIQEINMRCAPLDVLVHVGDAVTKGVARGIEGLRLKWADYRKRINCQVVLLEGNHDPQNKTKTVARHMISQIGPHRVFVSHYPTDSDTQDPDLMKWARLKCDYAICGHVHEKWEFKWDGKLLNVNIGVDQHNYRPVFDDELTTMVNKEWRGKT